MTIDFPSHLQISDLRSLWKEAFGDGDVFLDAFFETAFTPRRCRCITEADRPETTVVSGAWVLVMM